MKGSLLFLFLGAPKILKMTVVTKTVYIDKLDEIVEKYNKTFHRTIKIKHADSKMVTYFEYDVEVQSGQWCEKFRI